MNEQKEQKKAIKVLNLTVFLINFSIKMISKRNSLPLKIVFFHKTVHWMHNASISPIKNQILLEYEVNLQSVFSNFITGFCTYVTEK